MGMERSAGTPIVDDSMDATDSRQKRGRLIVAGAAAFSTYFCMYAFRKPFTAGTFEDQAIWGLGLKTVLVISQLLGYMLSKFIGIKVVSEMSPRYRAAGILGLILFAELTLVGFALASPPWQVGMMFLNGLPLGMVFGLVLSYLEGRRHTEALSAALCSSFIVSSGVVKSIGRWLLLNFEMSENVMPMIVGGIFFPPLLLAVWMLQKTPPPDDEDRRQRCERKEMNHQERRDFVNAFWPGLVLLVFVYVIVTVLRTIRDDFGVEIWKDLGVGETPSIFAVSETIVAFAVTFLTGCMILITDNLRALRTAFWLMSVFFAVCVAASMLQTASSLTPLTFMVLTGIGLYVPYVAFHTTIFERIIAASKRPSNLGFLMYLADSIGYLGYAIVMVFRSGTQRIESVLPFFQWTLVAGSTFSIIALVVALLYFQRRLRPAINMNY